MKKKILLVLLIFGAFVSCFGFKTNFFVCAEMAADVINYVSLGDSIAVGYGLYEHDPNDESDFVYGSYASTFKAMLKTKYGEQGVVGVSLAKSGDDTADLLSKLSLGNVQSAIRLADIVTICIGANDILGVVTSGTTMLNYLISQDGSENETSTKNQLLAGIDEGLQNFSTNFPIIIQTLKTLNSNAKFIFTNIYNPYKSIQNIQNGVTLSALGGYLNYSISANKLKSIYSITEEYLAGNGGLQVNGINNRMATFLSGQKNFYLIDSKTAFDNADETFVQLINAQIANYDGGTINITSLDYSALQPYVDPHPTSDGQQLLYTNFYNVFDENIICVNYDCNGGFFVDNSSGENVAKSNIMVLSDKGAKVLQPSQTPQKSGHNFAGWFKDASLQTAWDFETDVVNADTTLYAKWQEMQKQTFTITFNSNGGTDVSSQTVEYLSKATMPAAPTLNGYLFKGWYIDQAFSTQYNFDMPVSNNMELFAKWALAYNVTFNSNGGSAVAAQVVESGEMAFEPQVPTKSGCTFKGWFTDLELTNEYNFFKPVTENTNLYAKWQENQTQTFTITFNSNGGTAVSSQIVGQNQKVVKPQNPTKTGDNNIFAGWYYNNVLWNFDAQTVTQNITLVAKWVGMVCTNPETTTQIVDNIQTVIFKVDISDQNVYWYVDDVKQDGETSTTFYFTPIQAKAEYKIHCVVGGVASSKISVDVNYAKPEYIEAFIQQSSGGTFTFSIKNANFYNPYNFVWFATIDEYSEEVKQIGTGTTCKAKLSSNCVVYVVYNETLRSNDVIVQTGGHVDKTIYIIGGVLAGVVAFVVLVTVISKRRYKNYY